ncbi:MAG: TetR/AcrR family transcriptional regulator [Tepidisphaeraceae bacterium]
MANIKNTASAQETKRKLVEAAGEVFAEQGFERATIKDITERAGVSVASVNYHFSDKQELYFHVVQMAHDAGLDALRSLDLRDKPASAEERLAVFVQRFLHNTLHPSRPAWHSQIIANETRYPTEATQRFVTEVLRPYVQNLETLMVELIGHPVAPRPLKLLINSVISQCLFYCNNRCISERLHPNDPPYEQRLDEIADHITRFSLAAIQHMRWN